MHSVKNEIVLIHRYNYLHAKWNATSTKANLLKNTKRIEIISL